MSLGLKRGTVIVQPHRTEWDIAAQAYPEDRQAYTRGKSELIETILQSAGEWRKN